MKERESKRMKQWVVRFAINQGYARENVEFKGYEFRERNSSDRDTEGHSMARRPGGNAG